MKKLSLLFLLMSYTVHARQKITWPYHKKAVIVLTYDDGLSSQLKVAIPQLDSAHLTATFFLIGKELIAFVKKVQNSGGLGVFMFHGVGGDYINTPAAAHRQLLAYLVKNRKDIWVATFQQAMDYVTQTEKIN
ncbi:MAG TPA: hypothetical protein DCO83_14375 [Mucilaginibacter sp.]|jgi:hypothetical protein|nr:hypothetical protein [Mucilaginibacter sp.]